MIKFARFNDAIIELYWEEKIVGKVKVAVKRVLSLAGRGGNSTQDLGDTLAQTNLTSHEEDIPDSKLVVDDGTDNSIAPLTLSSSLNASTTISIPPNVAIRFVSIPGAGAISRNEVFLTFYTALLHVAQFPVESYLQSFHIASPSGQLHLHMQEVGIGCPVSPHVDVFCRRSSSMMR